MKNIKKMFLMGLGIFCSPISVLAASPGSWTPASEIQNIFIEGTDTNPLVTITLVNDPTDDYKPATCSSHYLTASLSTEKGSSLLSVLLAAKMAGKQVSFSFSSCSGSRPVVSLIRLS